MDVKTLGGKVNGCILAAFGIFVVIGFLAFLGSTGLDMLIGEAGSITAETAVEESVPAVMNMIRPGASVLWDESKRAVSGFLPTDAVSIGPLTINPVWKNIGDGSGGDSNSGASGSSASGGDSSAAVATATPIPCKVNTPESRAALAAWIAGDWEVAVANINITGEDDCLARGLYEEYMADFEIALAQLQNAQSESQIKAAAETIKRLNPAYPGSYSAIRFVEANVWLSTKPLDLSKKHLLAGAMININSADLSWWCGQHTALCQTQGDQFDATVSFGEGWAATYLFSRSELEQLQSALQLSANALTTVGNTVSVPGSVMPDSFPAVPAPTLDQYAAPTPSVVPTDQVLCPAGMTVQATWPRWEMMNGMPTETSIFPSGLVLTGEQLGDGGQQTLCKASDGSWAWPGSWRGWAR